MRPLLSILVLLVGALALAAGPGSAAEWRVDLHERCSYKLLSNNGVLLTASLTFRNARGGRLISVRVIPGWNIGRRYPKAETTFLLRLGPGQTARRVVTRRIPSVPRLRAQVKAGGVHCASTFTSEVQ